ncbi:hypothetical protein [Roseateles violae]|uniref:Uncharacterized protein n=1 Tax=Roseateles violae TaxID=3058042 RepID=A0ABT8DYZ6_9BURK|nr:hypothetical protein [Pelomonas sp. PFR6]MDN3922816.1 hypothetical protein [Pelomonas sp. PFR6]
MDSKDKPNASDGGLRAAVPVIVAALSLVGVLGGALLSNWDKVFGHRAAAQLPQAQPVDRLQGVWHSGLSEHPYQPGQRFRLRLEVQRLASGGIAALVADIPEGREQAQTYEAQSLQSSADGLDFSVERRWCCENGQERPYQVRYRLSLDPRDASQLLLSRRSNAPGAGQVERFVLEKRL